MSRNPPGGADRIGRGLGQQAFLLSTGLAAAGLGCQSPEPWPTPMERGASSPPTEQRIDDNLPRAPAPAQSIAFSNTRVNSWHRPTTAEDAAAPPFVQDAGPPPTPRGTTSDAGTSRPRDPTPPTGQDFEQVSELAGLTEYRASTGEALEPHGPGGIFTDLNGDGYADLFLVSDGTPVLYENVAHPLLPGSRTFVAHPFDASLGSTGAVAADYDNDGDVDVFVTNIGPDVLFENQLVETNELTFIDVTSGTDPTPDILDPQQGLSQAYHAGRILDHSLSAAFADVNRDGFLDLYVGTHVTRSGSRDTLYLGSADGTFRDWTLESGATGFQDELGNGENEHQEFSSTNAVLFADLDNDLWPDLIVTNKNGTDTDRDMLYRNLGATEAGMWLGFECITYSLPNPFGLYDLLAMGVNVADHDLDGDLDIYVTDFSEDSLYENQLIESGSLSFTHRQNLISYKTWGVQWKDWDRDGYPDLHVSSANRQADQVLSGTGKASGAAPLSGLAQVNDSRGSMVADYNRDGALDLFVVNLGTVSALYENQLAVSSDAGFLSVQLVGDPTLPGQYRSSRDALGARVLVTADVDGNGAVEVLRQDVRSGESNAASTSSFALHFGIGSAESVDVHVWWPSGRETHVEGLAANQFIELQEQAER